mmetsp:Transcript_818/g.1934  ORF Transcript_818/g.1934 Transcript_818/m.1934 type:complete len:200 (+) Transcript_818:422-1021(+)
MFLDQHRLHTWLPVSTHESGVAVCVFQKRMHRSAVPPPEASSPFWCGDQAMALTAAVCSLKRRTGDVECGDQMKSLLSLPPDASCCPSNDQRRPHTSCLWPESLLVKCSGTRTSRCRMSRSRLPDESVCPDQHSVPTRAWCPLIVRVVWHFAASHICTSPTLVPTARCVPRCVQLTEVTESSGPRSQSFVTLEVHALHR